MKSVLVNKYTLLIFIGLQSSLFGNIKAFGQLSEIKNNYAAYQQYHLQEKIYVHTDRSFYLSGEILWLKVYSIDATTNQPLSVSKVVYVEILDKQHQPVLRGKIAMKDGSGNGSFYLPFSVASGNYELRAYTNWMKNFSSDYFFKKNITIINTTKNLDSTAIHQSINYRVDFFPEGGNLVNGLQSEIAFKASDNNKGVDCEGVIIDQLNDTITRFNTFKFGMGHFYLNPEVGKNYAAIIKFKDGRITRNKLPLAYDTGYVMHVADTEMNNLKISIASKGITGNVYVIMQNNQHINVARVLSIENGLGVIVINKDSLEDGVTRITVFDANKQPRCERLYFKRPQNKMVIAAKADKNNYQFRSKVLIDISTTSQSENRLQGNLSVSVFRLDSLLQPGDENIFSYLWLSSELKGHVESPDYYFSSENEETNEALNNLMLAQGWRKYNWEKVLQNQKPSFKYVPEYSGHIITGEITGEITKKPASGVLVYLSVPGRRVQLKGCVSDSAGLVHFDMKDFYGANQIIIQTNKGQNDYHLEIFSPFSEESGDDVIPALYVSENDKDYLRSRNFHVEVENVYNEKYLQKMKAPLIDTLPFYSKSYKTYLLDNYTRFTTMEEVMREYVLEIGVRRKGDKFRFMSLNEPALALKDKQAVISVFETNPLVLLDGIPVFDINKIIAYDPLKVQKLEVVSEKYHWGPVEAHGIVSYTTYKGDMDGFALDPHDLVIDYDGLQQQRIFYSPDYSTDNALQSRLPDFRDVLYWSPNINTNEKGIGKFSFFTGDVPGKYWVQFQGISSNGDVGSDGFILNVTK